MKNEFNDKEFDDALRAKSLEHHPVPSPDVWGRIDHSIADAEAKKSRRKLFYFRWFIGILLILSSSLLIYILNNSSKKRQISLNENVSKVKEGNQIISKSTTGNIQNNKDMLSNAKNEFRNDNKILTNKNVNKIKDTVVNKVETITNNTVNKNSIATNNSITAKKITDNNSHNISYSANDIDTSAKEILHTFPVNMDSSKSYQQLFIKSDSVLTSSDSSHQLIPLMVEKKDTLMNEHPLSKNEMDSILKTKKNRWSFGISVLPMLTSIRGSNSQNSPTSNSAFEPTKEINQPFGIIAGANILYDLNSKKISIYGAINYYERFVHSEFSNIYVKNSPAPYQSFNTIGGSTRLAKADLQPFFDMNFGADSIVMNIDIKNRYYFLNIPLSLLYQALNKRMQISFLFGANVNYFFTRKTSAYAYDLSTGESKTIFPQNQIAFEKFHLGVQGGVEIGYNFKKSTFYLSPYYLYSVSPFVKNANNKVYPIGYGLGFGFRFRL